MDYREYTDRATSITEYAIAMSDGVKLKVIDFAPKKASKDAPVIVFVAGWISLISGWKGVLREITPRFRTIYLETREKRSSVVPGDAIVSFAMDRLRDDIGEAIALVVPKGKKFVLAGSSLGASAIIEYCAIASRLPECAVLVGPNAEFRFPKLLGDIVPAFPPSLYSVVKPVIKWYLRNFRLDKKREQEQIRKYENTLDEADPYKLKANALAIKNYAIWDKLPLVKAPCLIIGATSDTLHGTGALAKMREMIPRTDYRELASNKETHSEKAGVLIAEYLENRQYRARRR
jgi:pimeloyl-ACP methyl ester carboxylesterase